MTRSSDAYLKRPVDFSTNEQQLFYVGDNWPRKSWRRDAEKGLWLSGDLLEPEAINLWHNNLTIGADWTAQQCSVADDETLAGIDAATITENGTTNWRRIINNSISFANATVYTMSFLAKASSRSVVSVRFNNNGVTHWANWNLDTGTTGYSSGVEATGIEDWGDNVYRCWCKWTHDAAEARTPGISPRNADNNSDPSTDPYAGNSSAAIIVTAPQVETGTYPSSIIKTAGSDTTRTADSAIVHDIVRRPDDEAFFQILDTDSIVSSVSNLPAALTINGSTETPVFRYKGEDATTSGWPAWTYGQDLSIAGAGSDVTPNDGSPLLGSVDDSVGYSDASDKRHGISTTSVYDISTEDFVFEFVVKITSDGDVLCAKLTADPIGWQIMRTGGAMRLLVDDNTTQVTCTSAAITSDAWYHIMVFADRSGSAQWYINGEASGSPASIASVGDISSSAQFTFSSNSFDISVAPITANVAYAALWKKDGWLDTHLQADVAMERFSRLLGVYPQKALGTATPEVITRATCAYLDKLEGSTRKLYYVGDNWLRMCKREDDNSDEFIGYLSEKSATNILWPSSDMDSWVKTATVTSNDTVAPDGTTTADKIEADDGEYVYRTFGGFTPEDDVAPSVWIKRISTSGTLKIWNPLTGGYGRWDVDLSALPDEWVHITRSSPYITVLYEFKVYTNGGTGLTLSADGGTYSWHAWGAQLEIDYKEATSYIPTVGSSATRNGDQLRLKGNDGNVKNNGIGTIKADILMPDIDTTTNYPSIVCLNDGGGTDDRINLWLYTKQDDPQFSITEGGSAQAAINDVLNDDICDNLPHTVKGTWKQDNARLSHDGTFIDDDTSCNIPDDLDRIDIGKYVSDAYQLNGLIKNIRIYPKFDVE